MLIIKLAWRNIWRNKRRSLVLVLAIAITFFTLLFFRGLTQGALREGINNVINLNYGHIGIHEKGFNDTPKIKNNINVEKYKRIENILSKEKNVEYYARRIIGFGLINSARSSVGVTIVGIDPDKEPEITVIDEIIQKGSYLANSERNELLISRALAEKLNVGVGNKVILTGSTLGEEMSAEAYKVKGVFESESPSFDKKVIIAGIGSTQKLFGLGEKITGVVLRLEDYKFIERVRSRLREIFSQENLEFVSWQEAVPFLAKEIKAIKQFLFFNEIIFYLVVFLGIVNVFSMIIFERIRELGMMMAVGASPVLVFLLLIAESILVCSIGILIGSLLSFPVLYYLISQGLDLSLFSDVLRAWQIGNIVHFQITAKDLFATAGFLVSAGIIASLYPAYRACRFRPVEAIHHI